MFRGADKELKNSTGHGAYQVAVAASYHNLADAIQKFKPEEVGKRCPADANCQPRTVSYGKLHEFFLKNCML